MSKLVNKSEKMQIEGEHHKIATIYLLTIEILWHIHVEDFITYLWTLITHFWTSYEFLRARSPRPCPNLQIKVK